MIIVGIDPGIARVGYGVLQLERGHLLPREYGCIETSQHEALPQRLMQIQEELYAILQEYQPEEVAFEELFFYQNKTNAIMVAQARGVEVLTCQKQGARLYEYTPPQIKQALTGYGRATKKQMQEAVQRVLGLSEIPKPDDAADGLAIAITHAFAQMRKAEHEMR